MSFIQVLKLFWLYSKKVTYVELVTIIASLLTLVVFFAKKPKR
jgi:hypothetical protein